MYAIDYKTVESATLCEGKRCLQGTDGVCCPVDHCVMDRIHFIDREYETCPYMQSFDEGHVCTCPVRKEIFSRYGQ